MVISLEFKHAYDVEELRETTGLPNEPKKRFYPGALQTGKDGLLLKISPHAGRPWIGSFASSSLAGRKSLTRVISCPNPNEVCVISSGAGYIVRAENPNVWKSVPVTPVCDARILLDAGIIIFSDFTKLIAYGLDGLKWTSTGVSSDGIEIIDFVNGWVNLLCYNAPRGYKERIAVNLNDGSINRGPF